MTFAATLLALTMTGAGPSDGAVDASSQVSAEASEPAPIARGLRGLSGFNVRTTDTVVTSDELSCADPRFQAMRKLEIGATFHTEQTVREWPNAHLLIPDYPAARTAPIEAQLIGCTVEQAVVDSHRGKK